ncbi:uncharacterized protein LOC121802503 isoform X1 [Salvia splendens]|uniref:uncharacterized protein LOC121802503 isoform X1 n=1 Tax=Salvia splendens TaxID=180675 RepID=UPI001C25B8F5|nr:uncharacterized protein LOC121802503 isoform X1 [Salvia splendens]
MEQNLFELEKLTVSKTGHVDCRYSHRDVQVVESEHVQLNAHLLGRKHKSKLEILTTRKGELVILQVDGKFKYWCILCAAKLPNDLSLACHVGGKRHASNIDDKQTFRLSEAKIWTSIIEFNSDERL